MSKNCDLRVTFYLTKTENRTEKSNKALTLLLRVKVKFWPIFFFIFADFLQKRMLTSVKLKLHMVLYLPAKFQDSSMPPTSK